MAISPDMLKNYFDSAQKCKVSGSVHSVEKLSHDTCSQVLKIKIIGEDNVYYWVNGTQSIDNCIIDSYNKIYYSDIKPGEKISYILDDTYTPLEFDPSTVRTNNIASCTGNIIQAPITKTSNTGSFKINSLFVLTIALFLFMIVGIVLLWKKRKKMNN